MLMRAVIALLSLSAALGSPADPLLDQVLRHKRQLQQRWRTSPLWAARSRDLSRQLEDTAATTDGVSASGRAVRLVGGAGPWEGSVQVFTDSEWRPVTAARWSEHEASVVCRQLGHVSYFLPSAQPLDAADAEPADAEPAGAGAGPAPYRVHQCSGRESSLLECERPAAAARPAAVSCLAAADLSEQRCAPGELPFGDACYFLGSESVTRLKAELLCRRRGVALAVVNSQLENDFLSGVLSANSLEGLHTAGRGRRIGRDMIIWSWDGSNATFSFTKWNPAAPPSAPLDLDDRCLTLQPASSEGDKSSHLETDYAFWQSSDCGRRLPYVCEKPRDWTDCARDVAGSYAGSLSAAESGRPCLPWADVAPAPGLSSAALPENLCRNPDGDLRPWCFTGPDQFEYCDVTACPPHLPAPPAPTEDNYTCDRLQFACGDGRCTRATYVCDTDLDCPDGRDETICDQLPASFQTFAGKEVEFGSLELFADYVVSDSSLREKTCQFLCLADPSCFAVMYEFGSNTCFRVLRPLGEFRLSASALYTVHVVLSRQPPCAGHVCDDRECLERTALEVRCDGVADCRDASDEERCGAVHTVPLRLADGNSTHAGRLEARFRGRWGRVCDDSFNQAAANVACRQLGFRRHLRLYKNGRRFAAGADADVPFAVSFTACAGHERQLSDCLLLSDADRCAAGEHVSLQCTDQPGPCTLLPDYFQCYNNRSCVRPSELCDGRQQCSDGSDESEDVCATLKVRLLPDGSGRPPSVQVKPPGADRPFLNVTSRPFGQREADFLCGALGGGAFGVALEELEELSETKLAAEVFCGRGDCEVRTLAPGPAAHAVRLLCLAEPPPPAELRLTGGSERSGVLELRPPGLQWGRVCAASFTAQQARVACRQLGFGGEARFEEILERPRDPAATVSLRAMDCLGEENSISDCVRLPWANVTGTEVCGESGEVYLSCDDSAPPPAAGAPLTPQCAAVAADRSRVLNGAAGELAAFAQVHLQLGGEWKVRCGATVITERFLLTAAHCVTPSSALRLSGTRRLPVSRLSAVLADGERRAVRRVMPHPGHRLTGPDSDDLALVQLEEPVQFSAVVQPACLPPPDAQYSDQLSCTVAGYGATRPSLPFLSATASDTLQIANVTLFARADCERFYGRRNVTLGMVCAGDPQLLTDTCDGDSGGPLLCRLGDAEALMGVTSWGQGCGQKERPGVYTRVATYMRWIRDTIAAAGPPDAR